MRSFFELALTFASVLSASAQSVSINPGFSDLVSVIGNDTAPPPGPIPYDANSNAARRLGRRNLAKSHADRLDARQFAKRQNDSSPTPLGFITGSILITSADDNSTIGYLSSELNDFSEFWTTVNTAQDANAVKVVLPSELVSNGTSFANLPLAAASRFLGGTQGFGSIEESLYRGSLNYVYMTSVNQSPARSTGNNAGSSFNTATLFSKPSQSSIWSFDPATKALSITWTNTDGMTVVPVALNGNGESFIWTGDRAAFEEVYGATTAISYTFVADA